MTAAYTYSNMAKLAFFTTMLVAASIPALPAASRNWCSGVLCASANSAATLTTRSSVSAL
ncbi:hypothetical protein D3C81_2240230 [compost metagenome]